MPKRGGEWTPASNISPNYYTQRIVNTVLSRYDWIMPLEACSGSEPSPPRREAQQ
jgi:hypothetical protein